MTTPWWSELLGFLTPKPPVPSSVREAFSTAGIEPPLTTFVKMIAERIAKTPMDKCSAWGAPNEYLFPIEDGYITVFWGKWEWNQIPERRVKNVETGVSDTGYDKLQVVATKLDEEPKNMAKTMTATEKKIVMAAQQTLNEAVKKNRLRILELEKKAKEDAAQAEVLDVIERMMK